MEQHPPEPDPLIGVTDPWRFLSILREQVEKRDRPSYVGAFYDLIVGKHPLHQEALLKEAAPIFGFTLAAGRKELADREKKALVGHEPEFRASVAEQGILAEQIYRPGDLEHQTGFLVTYWDKPGVSPIFLPEIELGKRKIYPLPAKLARARLIYLPDSYEEYGTPADLFEEIRRYILTYVKLVDPLTATQAAAYILMSWVYDQFQEIPYFRAIGDYGVGKTRLLNTVGLACYRPTLAAGALTGPALFRLLEQTLGSLILDEADFEPGTEIAQDITKCLNVGFQQRYGVLRNERDTDGSPLQVRSYRVFGPKVLATRRGFKDAALESRCLSHSLPLLERDPRIPIYLDPATFDRHVQKLRNKLVLWRFRTWGHLTIHPFQHVLGMEPRMNQILLPILAVAPTPEIHALLVEGARRSAQEAAVARLQTVEGRLVEAVLWLWWHRPKTTTRILLKAVTERLQSVGELKDISSQTVSGILNKTLDIQTDRHGGTSWVTLTPRQVVRLATSYHLEIPDEWVCDLPDEVGEVLGLLARKHAILRARAEENGQPPSGPPPEKKEAGTPITRRAL